MCLFQCELWSLIERLFGVRGGGVCCGCRRLYLFDCCACGLSVGQVIGFGRCRVDDDCVLGSVVVCLVHRFPDAGNQGWVDGDGFFAGPEADSVFEAFAVVGDDGAAGGAA